jgi:hypothetical protein
MDPAPTTWPQDVAVLLSDRSRHRLIDEARAAGAVYEFTGADGRRRTWLRGEYAHLAPPAASTFLTRWNVKHDVVDEDALFADLDRRRAVVLPTALDLAPATIDALVQWLADPSHRLVVSGRTSLPPALLGVVGFTEEVVVGATAWGALDPTITGGETTYDEVFVSGAPGSRIVRCEAGDGARVLADLRELRLPVESSLPGRRIGAGIVTTDRTLYIANDPFELLGAAMQAHVSVEGLRGTGDTLHWGDAIAAILWLILRGWDEEVATVRLRAFGSHSGVLSLRHDVDASTDRSMLELEVDQLVPATYHVLDPVISAEDTTADAAAAWIHATAEHDFLEAGLHNESGRLEHITGSGLAEHVAAASERLGATFTNTGRHNRYHAHPETLDAMAHGYDHLPDLLGMCSFSFFWMLEYAHPPAEGPIDDALVTYTTGASRTIATSGFWWPFHPVITSVEEYRVLRGWDVTHEYDADPDLVDAILAPGQSVLREPRPTPSPRVPPWDDAGESDAPPRPMLDGGVYTIQYHPLFTSDPTLNDGRGTLPWLRWAIASAERRHLWIANKTMLHRRLIDYEVVRFRRLGPDAFVVANPTDRRIECLWIESAAPAWGLDSACGTHVLSVDRRFVALPPLEPRAEVTFRFVRERPASPLVAQRERRGLTIVDALVDRATGTLTVVADVTRRQSLRIANLRPDGRIAVTIEAPGTDEPARRDLVASGAGLAVVDLEGPAERSVRLSIRVR